jgi:hypothetical protein
MLPCVGRYHTSTWAACPMLGSIECWNPRSVIRSSRDEMAWRVVDAEHAPNASIAGFHRVVQFRCGSTRKARWTAMGPVGSDRTRTCVEAASRAPAGASSSRGAGGGARRVAVRPMTGRLFVGQVRRADCDRGRPVVACGRTRLRSGPGQASHDRERVVVEISAPAGELRRLGSP